MYFYYDAAQCVSLFLSLENHVHATPNQPQEIEELNGSQYQRDRWPCTVKIRNHVNATPNQPQEIEELNGSQYQRDRWPCTVKIRNPKQWHNQHVRLMGSLIYSMVAWSQIKVAFLLSKYLNLDSSIEIFHTIPLQSDLRLQSKQSTPRGRSFRLVS